jgi:hypothetical protein
MRYLFGFMWFVGIYFVGCVILGGIAGGIAGANNPQNAGEAGAIAGREIVTNYRHFVIIGAALVAAAGTFTGILPGTKAKPEAESEVESGG